jgi:hypothetical protein
MLDNYLVTSSGIKDGKPISYLAKIVEVKKGNDNYIFTDTKTFPKIIEEIIPMGTIISYELNRVETPATSAKGNIKLGT